MSKTDTPSVDNDPQALAVSAARCFAGADGDRLLAYLRTITTGRALGPAVPDAQLRHLEGQRYLVQHLGALIERGRNGSKPPPAVLTDEPE